MHLGHIYSQGVGECLIVREEILLPSYPEYTLRDFGVQVFNYHRVPQHPSIQHFVSVTYGQRRYWEVDGARVVVEP